ncbi:MAG TPA: hypothetical protein VE755_06740 [Myxococcales bacterium]|jgi:hypothetical protein|nr:hypothetical protein [Myxococcales bacterium]
MMRAHVFGQKPKYCLALKPAVIWVRCAKCGAPHEEYLGPSDLDAKAAETAFLRQEYVRTAAFLTKARSKPRPGRSR